jgi:ABC-type proline/glycine betaine transport system permease subunit
MVDMENGGKCGSHSGILEAVTELKKDRDTLFRKIEHLQYTAISLLIAVIADILTRIYMHAPK